jgi:hypothetical protein
LIGPSAIVVAPWGKPAGEQEEITIKRRDAPLPGDCPDDDGSGGEAALLGIHQDQF